jgi:hypothetical protein
MTLQRWPRCRQCEIVSPDLNKLLTMYHAAARGPLLGHLRIAAVAAFHSWIALFC